MSAMTTFGGRSATTHDRLCDVRAAERLKSFVHAVGAFLIPMEAHDGELGLNHAGIDGVGGRRSPVPSRSMRRPEVDAVERRLRRRVHRTTRIGRTARDRSDVDDVPAAALQHAREQRTRHAEHAPHVRLDHAVPVVGVRVLHRSEAGSEPRRVDEHVDIAPVVGQRTERRRDGLTIADVQRHGQRPRAVLLLEVRRERLEPVPAPRDEDEAVTRGSERVRARLADTARGTRDQDRPLRHQNTTVDPPCRTTRSAQCHATALESTIRSMSAPERRSAATSSRCATRITSCSMIGPASRSSVT